MKPTVVVDVGNSRIKWGRCADGRVLEAVSLPPEDQTIWQAQADSWGLPSPASWAVCGVDPARRDRLLHWITERGDSVLHLRHAKQLPLAVNLEFPDKVGIDRLMDAVAAKSRCDSTPAIIVDAGSAVTVDWLDANGTYCGGAIFPGLRLMTEALHTHTALLPIIEIKNPAPPLPGTSTPAAMEAGVFWAVIGGIQSIATHLEGAMNRKATRFITGGDSALLHQALGDDYTLWPAMTLEGIRIAAEELT
jgi:type III pantothenate kinase